VDMARSGLNLPLRHSLYSSSLSLLGNRPKCVKKTPPVRGAEVEMGTDEPQRAPILASVTKAVGAAAREVRRSWHDWQFNR